VFWLQAANVAFFVLHTALCLFNLLGWAHSKTRRLHLVSMGLTALSWFVFGIWRGWGYCLCTDWHMKVREAMGIRDESRMYVQLLIEKLSGFRLSESATEWITGGGFFAALALGVGLHLRDRRRAASQRLA